jgi:hypothetical protein
VDGFIRIDWRGLPPQAGAEAFARQEAARLAASYPELSVWRVALEASAPGPASRQVCASVEVRGWQRQVILNRAHADASIALREVFAAIFRKFERRARSDRRAPPRSEKQLRAA